MLPGKRLGIVIPSSNVVIEPLAAQQFYKSDTTVHFSRLGVVDIKLDAGSLAQFEMGEQLSAAQKLRDARVDAVVWGGTSSSWLGFERDEEYCKLIEQETGISVTTCVLEMNRKVASLGARRIAMVTPYTDDVHNRILDNYEGLGFPRPTGQNLGGIVSNDFASISPNTLEDMILNVAKGVPDVIMIMCTNLRGAGVAEDLSKRLGLPVIDSAAATLQAGSRLISG
ncbi:MAG: aspartate/glutamate racemase family protein [Planktomarina sp.]|nr:aspartate/glutamate racemase family protein [Planktomarina sp.]